MIHYRATLRAEVAAAITATEHFTDATIKKAWAKRISEEELPCYAVTTPREVTRLAGCSHEATREISVAVALRRSGDETLEDLLDLDAAEIERAVIPALEAFAGFHTLEAMQTDLEIDHEGGNRLGTVVVQFRITLIGTLGAPAS